MNRRTIFSTGDLIREAKLAIGDGYRAKNAELTSQGLPFARAGNIDGGFHFEDADHFPEPNLDKVGPKVSRPGDVVFTSKGTVGRLAFVQQSTPRFVFSPQLSYWRSLDRDLLDPRYLFYWMHGREFWVQAAGVKGQTDMADYVSLTDQRRMRITLPEISEQRTVARILGSLDDKIDLNREMNRTLEAMAQALFRSWFVDFDPVVAKANGQKPFGMSADVASLFPDRFVNSEMGPIPEGWEQSTIGEETVVVGGSTPSTRELIYWVGGDIHWATPKDLSGQTHSVLMDTARRITQAGLEKISSGLLPKGTVLLSSRAPIGYLAIAEVPTAVNQGFIAMHCAGRLGSHYVLRWAAAEMPEIEARAGGTTFAEISKRSFRPIPVLVPDGALHTQWHRTAAALHAQVVQNLQESHTLADLRDTLLPKLLSGEIRVTDAEKAIEASA